MRSQGLTRLAAGLAHDIKNPLNAMALQLALLADKLSIRREASSAAAGAPRRAARSDWARERGGAAVPRRDRSLRAARLHRCRRAGGRRASLFAPRRAPPPHRARRWRPRAAREARAAIRRGWAAGARRLAREWRRPRTAAASRSGSRRSPTRAAGARARRGATRAPAGYEVEVARGGARGARRRLEIDAGRRGERVVLRLPRNRRE